jgi:hypothetical protein
MASEAGMGELLEELVRFAEAHRRERLETPEADAEVRAATERLLARRATISDLAVYGRARGWSLAKSFHLLGLMERLHRLMRRRGGTGALLGELSPAPAYPLELFDPADVEANRAVRWSLVMPWKDRLEGDMARTLYLAAARLLKSEEPWERDVLVTRDRVLGLTADAGVLAQELSESITDLTSLGAADDVLAPLVMGRGRVSGLVPDLQSASRWLSAKIARSRAADEDAPDAS